MIEREIPFKKEIESNMNTTKFLYRELRTFIIIYSKEKSTKVNCIHYRTLSSRYGLSVNK